VRLKALLPAWVPWARRRLRLTAATEQALLRISARQIDRRLQADKRTLRTRIYGRTKPGTLLKHHIPVQTARWNVQEPGFTEIDLVSHSGACADGEFLHSLNVTDIHTTWVETQAVLGKSQERVRQALATISEALPFALRGIDSDNGQNSSTTICTATVGHRIFSSRADARTRKTTTRISSRKIGPTSARSWAMTATIRRAPSRRSTPSMRICGCCRICGCPR
jgi:hypothetical protein